MSDYTVVHVGERMTGKYYWQAPDGSLHESVNGLNSPSEYPEGTKMTPPPVIMNIDKDRIGHSPANPDLPNWKDAT